tara:strand:+ start:279 stop:383 length:105 start_codon:yes stop_codon:yes gene_type:complete
MALLKIMRSQKKIKMTIFIFCSKNKKILEVLQQL